MKYINNRVRIFYQKNKKTIKYVGYSVLAIKLIALSYWGCNKIEQMDKSKPTLIRRLK